MPLQNRVDPLGAIQAVDARGLFTGNRGVIHDPETRQLLRKRWTSKAWIICTLAYKNRPARDVMGRNAQGGGAGWTELFFLDEVTALAAGHRPCFFCRRDAAKGFIASFPFEASESRNAPNVDRVLHGERIASGGNAPVLQPEDLATLPDGAMILVGSEPHALLGGTLLPWSFAGYGAAVSPEAAGRCTLITPRSTVAALAAGYRPVWHPTARP